MEDSESGVAVADIFDDDSKGDDIGEFFKGECAVLHFSPDGVDSFDSSIDFGVDSGVGEDFFEIADDFVDLGLSFFAEVLESAGEGGSGFGLDFDEGEFFELGSHAIESDAFCERRVDFHGFDGEFSSAGWFGDTGEGLHVVHSVSEFDEEDSDIVAHSEHEFSEVFGVGAFLG